MKKKLLSALLLATLGMSAQTTHMINWYNGVPTSESNIAVNNGDTVEWTITDGMAHTITTLMGSVENFDSGDLAAGTTYSHTFLTNGSILYYCKFHSNMIGAISVSGTAGSEIFERKELVLYPNPVNNIATISSNEIIDKVEVYNVSGQKVYTGNSQTDTVKLYLDNYTSGFYIVKVYSGSLQKEFSVVKN